MSGSHPDAAAGVAAAAAGAPAFDGARWRRRRRAALIGWAALTVVVWNVIFDAVVIQSGRDYLTRQALHQQGRGPAVTIPEVMRPGILRGAWLASLAGGGIVALGAVGLWAAERHRRRVTAVRLET